MNPSEQITNLATWLFVGGWWLPAMELKSIAQAVQEMERKCVLLDQIVAGTCDVERAIADSNVVRLADHRRRMG